MLSSYKDHDWIKAKEQRHHDLFSLQRRHVGIVFGLMHPIANPAVAQSQVPFALQVGKVLFPEAECVVDGNAFGLALSSLVVPNCMGTNWFTHSSMRSVFPGGGRK